MSAKLERQITITPAYDRRHPDPARNYGIGSATMSFYVSSPLGVVQLVIGMGWYLEHAVEEFKHKGTELRPKAYDLGYHSPRPMYEGQKPRPACPHLNGQPCYYDGTTLGAVGPFKLLITQGLDALWEFLEAEHRRWFPTNDLMESSHATN